MLPSLNLLSPDDKKNLRQSRRLLIAYEFAILGLLAVVLSAGALFFARTTLETKFQEVTLAEIPGSSKLTTLDRDVRTINQTIARLAVITGNATYVSPKIAEIIARTPAGIKFNAFHLEANGKVTIQGVANNRNDLAKFRDTLGISPEIVRINLPLQYFVEQEQVEFTVEIILKTI